MKTLLTLLLATSDMCYAKASAAQTHPNVSGHEQFEYIGIKGRPGFSLTIPEHKIWYDGEADRFRAAKASKQQFYQCAQAWARSVTAANNIHTATLPNGILVLKASITDPFSYENNLGTVSTHMTYNITGHRYAKSTRPH